MKNRLNLILLAVISILMSSCSDVLMNENTFLCNDSNNAISDYNLIIHRSFFEKSNLMKIPSRVEVLGKKRTICKEDNSTIWAGENCRGSGNEKQSLVFNKQSGKLDIIVSPSLTRRGLCKTKE